MVHTAGPAPGPSFPIGIFLQRGISILSSRARPALFCLSLTIRSHTSHGARSAASHTDTPRTDEQCEQINRNQ
eukprot:scaffold3213_cov66-Phaeocystis_antarctica.AAC.1